MTLLLLPFKHIPCTNLENGQPHTDRFRISGCFIPPCVRAISRTLTSLLLPGTFRPSREEKKEGVLESPSGAPFKDKYLCFYTMNITKVHLV